MFESLNNNSVSNEKLTKSLIFFLFDIGY